MRVFPRRVNDVGPPTLVGFVGYVAKTSLPPIRIAVPPAYLIFTSTARDP